MYESTFTKRDNPALEKIPDDEPVFIIRGQDRLALETIEEWIILARVAFVSEEKIATAYAHLADMALWQADHPERVKTPD